MLGFFGLFRYEFAMSIRRKGLWIAYGLLFAFHTFLLFAPAPLGEFVAGEVISEREVFWVAARFLVAVNVLFPVVVGILSADRVLRDFGARGSAGTGGMGGMRELQESTPLPRLTYGMAKFTATLAASLLPVFFWVLGIAITMVSIGHAPASFLVAVPLAFFAITVPAFGFVIAFSLVGPLLMPLSVYQVLFTGYWFWANFIPPQLFPTLNGTLLTPSGIFAAQAFFHGEAATKLPGAVTPTPSEAALNLLVLALATACALALLDRVLARKAQR